VRALTVLAGHHERGPRDAGENLHLGLAARAAHPADLRRQQLAIDHHDHPRAGADRDLREPTTTGLAGYFSRYGGSTAVASAPAR